MTEKTRQQVVYFVGGLLALALVAGIAGMSGLVATGILLVLIGRVLSIK